MRVKKVGVGKCPTPGQSKICNASQWPEGGWAQLKFTDALGVQVVVDGEEWMVLAIDKYDYGIF